MWEDELIAVGVMQPGRGSLVLQRCMSVASNVRMRMGYTEPCCDRSRDHSPIGPQWCSLTYSRSGIFYQSPRENRLSRTGSSAVLLAQGGACKAQVLPG